MVKVNDQLIKCSYKNQVVEFKIKNKSKKTLTVHFGNLVCPSCEEICHVSFLKMWLWVLDSCFKFNLIFISKDEITCPTEEIPKIISTNLENFSKQNRAHVHNLNTALNSENENSRYFSSYLNLQHEYCLKQMSLSQSIRLKSEFLKIQIFTIIWCGLFKLI